MPKPVQLRALLAASAVTLFAGMAAAAPLTFDANRQYFNYNGKTLALVGASAEYLCHIQQPAANANTYCTWNNNPQYFANLAGKGMNKIRMWVGLNHSPGTSQNFSTQVDHSQLTPYTFEQPFAFQLNANPALDKLWNLDVWEETYFNRVFNTIQAAAATQPPIMVEVTLFDAEGVWENGPWHDSKNTQNAAHSLTDAKYFLAFDTVDHDTQAGNIYVRDRQRAFLRKMVAKLNSLDNFYWELSNEPDLSTGVDLAATQNWHNAMLQEILQAEQPANLKKHMIAVNFATTSSVEWARSKVNLRLISGHYATASDSRLGAEELIRTYLVPGNPNSIDKAYGFNEDWITPFLSTPDSVRVEAWEFMLNEGGSFDHLGYDWNVGGATSAPAVVRTQLGVLARFLNGQVNASGVEIKPGLNLAGMGRVQQAPPLWCPGVGAYSAPAPPTGTPVSRTYYSSMQWADNDYLLYIHHSILNSEQVDPLLSPPKKRALTRYMPVSGSYQHTFSVTPGTQGRYKAEWIDPKTGNALSAPGYPFQFDWSGNQATSQPLPTSPVYPIDVLLRVSRVPV
jgi:hypothetical protein